MTSCSTRAMKNTYCGYSRRFFEIFRTRRLIISLPTSDFFLDESHGVAALSTKVVYALTHNISGLKDSEPPRTAAELCEYVHGLSWTSNSIPRFAERVASLRALSETAYTKAGGNQKKNSIAKFALSSLGWN